MVNRVVPRRNLRNAAEKASWMGQPVLKRLWAGSAPLAGVRLSNPTLGLQNGPQKCAGPDPAFL